VYLCNKTKSIPNKPLGKYEALSIFNDSSVDSDEMKLQGAKWIEEALEYE